jgi:hypothetical protein
MGLVGRLRLKSIWRPFPTRHARPRPSADASPNALGDQRLGTGLAEASVGTAALEPGSWVTYSLDLDIGEVALGYHLIARSVSLSAEDLLFEYAFLPGLTDEARKDVWLNMFYDADISPPNWNYVGADGDVQYERPPLEARHAWFDFFRPDFEWDEHLNRGQPDGAYLRNRIARLIFDLKTGAAQIEAG